MACQIERVARQIVGEAPIQPTCTCKDGAPCNLCACIHEAARLWAARLSMADVRRLYRQSQLPPAISNCRLTNHQVAALFERLSPWAPEES